MRLKTKTFHLHRFRSFLFACLMVLGLAACNILEDLIKIPVRLNSEVVIPAGTGVGILVDVFSDETETQIDEEMNLNDTRVDLIKTIRLRECVLTITSPSGTDFSFLNDIQIFLTDPELGDVLIAYLNNIEGDGTDEIELSVDNDVDVADYIKQENIKIKTKVITDEILLNNITVNVFTRFRVTADLF